MIKSICLRILVVVFLLPGLLSAEVYYVDSTAGNDNAVGTSPSSAWKSLSKVMMARAIC